jgi:iron complex transport system permease protein
MKLYISLILLITLTVLSLVLGTTNIFDPTVDTPLLQDILIQLRLPRTLAALTTGGVLGLSGAVLQGFLRNPLADASLLGIGPGAALFAVIAISLGLASANFFVVPVFAIMGAIITILFLNIFLSGQYSPLRLILAGIALNSLYGALTALILNLSDNPYAMMQMLFWLFGSYADISLLHMLMALPFMVVGCYLLWKTGPLLNALSLGEDMAKTLGFSLKKGYLSLILGTGLAIGVSVALCGIIGFIGLVVPHIMRIFFGSKPSKILIPSAIGGGCLSLLADITVRLLPCHMELKVGVMTSLIGAPFFIYLLYRSYHADI